MTMHEIDLTRVDLNLLVVFEALMQERHVGRAAHRLSLSQSATSHALGRLRDLFGDPLFVRHPRGIAPTLRGRELDQPVALALTQLRQLFQPATPFDPATLQRTFTIAMHDYALAVLMPAVAARLQRQAPGVNVRCISLHPARVIDALDRGELDCALGGFIGIHADRVRRLPLFTDRFVGVARRGHPRVRDGQMALADFVSVPHVLMSPDGTAYGDIDDALASLGLARRIAMTVPNFLALAPVIGTSDMLGVLPERLALRAASGAPMSAPMTVFDLPLALEPITCNMLVLAPLAGQPALAWLTTLLQDSAALLPPA